MLHGPAQCANVALTDVLIILGCGLGLSRFDIIFELIRKLLLFL